MGEICVSPPSLFLVTPLIFFFHPLYLTTDLKSRLEFQETVKGEVGVDSGRYL